MIVDKIGQEIGIGDFVISAFSGYSGGAPGMVVGTVEKISDKGNVSIRTLNLVSGKWAGTAVHMCPERRMVKLTSTQLDAINLLLDGINATKAA